jgi:hypothetical protein
MEQALEEVLLSESAWSTSLAIPYSANILTLSVSLGHLGHGAAAIVRS